jgi:hypothetical protein
VRSAVGMSTGPPKALEAPKLVIGLLLLAKGLAG